MKKKLVLLLSVLLTIPLLILPLVGCGEPTETTPADSPFTQLQAKVTTLSTKVAGLETAIANISIPADLTTRVSDLESQATSIQNDVGDLEIIAFGAPTQDDIDAIEVDVFELGLRVDTTNDEVVGNLAGIEALQTEYADHFAEYAILVAGYDALVIELAGLQAQVDELGSNGNGNGNGDTATEPEGYQDLLDDVAGLQATIADAEVALAEIDDDLSDLWLWIVSHEDAIVGILATLDDIDEDLTAIDDLWNELDDRLGDIETVVHNTYWVVISEFYPGLQLKIRTITAGNYVIILTLYGSGFVDLTSSISIPTADKVEVISDKTYAGGTIRTIVLEPDQVLAGNPPALTDVNWKANEIIGVYFAGAGTVSYATIETGAR